MESQPPWGEGEDPQLWEPANEVEAALPLSVKEKEQIFRCQFEIAITHELNVAPVDKWEPDEARDFLESSIEEQTEIMAEKSKRASDLRRKIGNTDGLIGWFIAQLHEHNPDVVDLLCRYQCFRSEVLPDENTFKFMAALNRIRTLYENGTGPRRSPRLLNGKK
jgi:hypothetical protein